MGYRDGRFEELLGALEREPDDADVAAEIARVAADTNRWIDLAKTVNAWLQAATESGRKASLSLILARWYALDLERPDYAQPYLQQVLAIDPRSTRVLRLVAEVFVRQGQPAHALAALDQALAIETAEPARRAIQAEIAAIRPR